MLKSYRILFYLHYFITGYDGGLQTTYFVEAWEMNTLIANVSTITPIWKLQGLGSGKELTLVFYANNARGRSEVTTLRIHTLSRLALHTGIIVLRYTRTYVGNS